MPQRPSRSLKHEYELYVEREIENYKESVPRSVLLSIGDDAVRALAGEQQFALTELLLWDEVDRIIFKRLRLPSYRHVAEAADQAPRGAAAPRALGAQPRRLRRPDGPAGGRGVTRAGRGSLG